jgi:hypothetical protein
MTRESLMKNLPSKYFEILSKNRIANWQGDNCVSLCCNPNNFQYIKKFSVKDLDSNGNDFDSAYEDFVLSFISLVIDKKVFENAYLDNDKSRMNYEILIKGDISTKYIKAIGIPHDDILTDLYLLKKILFERLNNKKGKYFNKYYSKTCNIRYELSEHEIEEIIYRHYSLISGVKKILESLSIDLPIIDIKYGYQLLEEQDLKTKLHKTKNIYHRYLNYYNYK